MSANGEPMPELAMDHGERYLSPDQVCEIIPGMTRALLGQMRFRGDGPKFIKPSPKKVVYRESAVHEYLLAREQTTTAASA